MPEQIPRWTPADLVVSGSLCPDQQISDALVSICETELRCSFGVMLIFAPADPNDVWIKLGTTDSVRTERFFQSLAFCYHVDAGSRDKIRYALRQQLGRPERAQIKAQSVVLQDQQSVPFADLSIIPYGTTETTEGRGPGPFARLGAILSPALTFNLKWHCGAQERHGEVVLGLLTGHQGPSPSTSHQELDRLLAELYLMVSGSAPVHVYRGLELNRRVDEILDGTSSRQRGARFPGEQSTGLKVKDRMHNLSSRMVEAAVTVTQSTIGSIYLADQTPSRLTCYAQHGVTRDLPELCIDRDKSVVTNAFSRKRPFFVNNVNRFREMHAEIQYLPPERQANSSPVPTAELAVPILYPHPEGGPAIAFGVLNVEKHGGEYSVPDLMALRSIAQHFSGGRSQILSSYVSESLATVTAQQASSLETRRTLLSSISRGQEEECDKELFWPIEFLLSKRQVEETLQVLAEVTRSHHITVRLATDSGRALVRFAEWPQKGTDEHRALSVKSVDSANAWVFRNGLECHIPNLLDSSCLTGFPELRSVIRAFEGLRSELCLPIFVQGRIVGTLDLESLFTDSYTMDLTTIRLVLELIRLFLRQAQRTLEEDILSRYTSLNLSIHEIAKCGDTLEQLAKSLVARSDLDGSGIALKTRDRLNSAIQACETLGALAPVANPRMLLEEISCVAQERRVTMWTHIEHEPELDIEPFPNAPALQAFRLALGEVLDNAFSAINRFNQQDIRIFIKKIVRGCTPHLHVEIAHNDGTDPPARWIQRCAYRVPLFLGTRLHYGAFLTGALLRSLGGDVRLFHMERDKSVRTVIELPWLSAPLQE